MPTKIEWARNADGSQGETWNPLRAKLIDGKPNISKSGHFGTGCTMVSPGCQNCYAGTINRRFYGNDYSYHSKPSEFFLDERILGLPVRRKKPTVWFVGSMLDVFHEEIPYDLIWRMFMVMRACNWHTFQVLTKRPENMRTALDKWGQWRLPFKNVWLGVSAENQEMADLRIPILLKIPAVVRWVSFEPLLGPILLGPCGAVEMSRPGYEPGEPVILSQDPNFPQIEFRGLIDWAVVGGESGTKARPMHPDWARSLRDQCLKVGIPFFFKQWGAWGPVGYFGDDPDEKGRSCFALPSGIITDTNWNNGPGPHLKGGQRMWRFGKKLAGRVLDHAEWNQMPARGEKV